MIESGAAAQPSSTAAANARTVTARYANAEEETLRCAATPLPRPVPFLDVVSGAAK